MDNTKDYHTGVVDGLVKALELVELQWEKEMFLGAIDEAGGIYQAKLKITRFLEKYPCTTSVTEV